MARSGLSGSAETLRMLKTYETDLYKEFRKNVNSQLKPVIAPIEGEINSSVTSSLRNQMKGMFHDGRSAWSGVKVTPKVSLRPRDLLFIEGKGRNAGLDTQVGFEYAELAGIERRPPRPVSKGWGSTDLVITATSTMDRVRLSIASLLLPMDDLVASCGSVC